MTFSSHNYGSVGGRLLLLKQQTTHQKRLQEIYQRTPTNYASTPVLRKNIGQTKQQKFESYEHHQNIKHLFSFISRTKNMQDRLKDPHDFYAYPAYFFRNEDTKQGKNYRTKKRRATKNDDLSEQSQFTRRYGIDVPTVKSMLPELHQFSQQQIENYGEVILGIAQQFNLKSTQQIQYLKTCVLKATNSHYPKQFPQLVEEMFKQIVNFLNIK